MKIFKYLIALVAGAMAFTACEKDPADLFSADATAPVMDSHADILLTENSVTETLTFSWKAARNMGDQILYTLYATLEGQEVALGTTETTYISAGKEAFREKLLTGFGLSGNDNFSIGMYVAADNGAQVLKSEAVTMNVYVYGDYVPAIVSVAEGAEGGIVLTDAMTEDIELINWTAARFEYGTNPLYKVEISYNDGARQELASGMAAQKFSMAPSTLNSTLIALGCPKDAASDVQFIVTSYLEGEGAPQLESMAVTVKVTTYTPSYPEFVQLCGDFGGHAWNTESALPILKGDPNTGVYHGVVSIYGQEWGFKVIYTNPKDQSVVWMGGTATSEAEPYTFTISASAGNMMQVADGAGGVEGTFVFYLDLAAAQLTMAPVSSIGLIGSATANGWDAQTNFEYNAETGAMELKNVTLGEGAYKVRVNDNWGNPWEDPYAYNLGGDPNNMTFGGSDIPSEPGVYDITMNLSTSANYALTFAKTGDVVIEDPMTKNYGLVGTINNWGETADLVFEAVEGENYKIVKNVTLKAEDQIKVRVDSDWAENYGGPGETEPYAMAANTKVTLVAGGKNISMAAGSYDIYFYPKTKEMIAVAAGAGLPTGESIYGLVGVHNNWAAPDVKFTDNGNGEHVLLGMTLGASEGFKIRANEEWNDAENYGTLNGGIVAIDTEVTLTCGGGSKDMMVEVAGSYDIYFYPSQLKIYVMTPGKTPTDAGDPVVPPTPTETVYSVAGDFNGWSDTDLVDNGDGFFVLKGQLVAAGNGFKFKKNHSWADADCWGVDAGVTTTVGAAISLVQPGSNIPVPAEGTYDFYFNPTTATAYVMNAGEVPGTPAPAAHTYSIVGSFNGWNQTDTTYTMTASGTDTYTFSNIALNAYDEFKIVEDYAWTVSYGAAATVVLDQKFALTSNNGGNIVMPATGTFNITFYAATSELLIESVGTVTPPAPESEQIEVGLIGVGGDWNTDIKFTQQADGSFKVENVSLTAADTFKVRKAGAWDDAFNWGLAAAGTLPTGVETDLVCAGGSANMSVEADGKYNITFTPTLNGTEVVKNSAAKIKVEKIVETPSTPATPLEWGNDVFKNFFDTVSGGDKNTEVTQDLDFGNGLKFIAGSGKCKFGSDGGMYRFQYGGSGAFDKQTLELTVSGPGTLELTIRSSNKTEERYLGVWVDQVANYTEPGYKGPMSGESPAVHTIDCSSAKAGSKINFHCLGSGINVYNIKWTPKQ